MKKNLFLILVVIFISCDYINNSKEKDFFYSTVKPEIYSINDKNEVIVYNVLDSTRTKFKTDESNFFYKNESKNELVIKTSKDTLNLSNLHFRKVNLEHLKNTKWLLYFEENNQKIEQILRIDEEGGLFLSQKNSNEMRFPYYGILFDKFYSYRMTSIVLLINHTDITLEVLNINYFNNHIEKYTLKKID